MSFDLKLKKLVLFAYMFIVIVWVDLNVKIIDDVIIMFKKKCRCECECGVFENYVISDVFGGVRVVKFDNSCLYLGYVGVNKVFLIECLWVDVFKFLV